MSRLVVGLGNNYRRDDGAGLAVARRVRSVPVREVNEPGNLLDMWRENDDVIVIDAVVSGAPAGTIHRMDVGRSPLPVRSTTSSHAFGLADVIELARSLDRLPRSIRVYGIEIGSLEPGRPMSPSVNEAVDAVAQEIDRA